MITLTWKEINNAKFAQAVMKLASVDKLDRVTAYRVGRIHEVALRESQKMHDVEEKLREKYIKKDEKGVQIKDEAGNPQFVENGAKDLAAEFKKIEAEKEVSIKVHKLDFNQITGLNALEINSLLPLMENIPAE